MHSFTSETKLCAVIGNPVRHSLSPAIHNAAFEAKGLNYTYLAFEVEDLGASLSGMRVLRGFRGMSVTIPHKIAVMEYLDEVSSNAQNVGSVNTITNENGKLVGTTTDGPGALRAFAEAKVDLAGRRVLFVGAGGAVRAVAFAMAEQAKIEKLTILARRTIQVDELVRDLSRRTNADVSGGDLGKEVVRATAQHDVIVQGTPMGMAPDSLEESAVPPECLRSEHVVFDMVYRPARTRLVQQAQEVGCTIIPGVDMLIFQAALQFEIWTGHPAPIEAMRAAVLKELTG